jgi:hypothetical protein
MGYYNRFLDWFLRAGSGPEPSHPSKDVRQEEQAEQDEGTNGGSMTVNVEEVTISINTEDDGTNE